MHSLCAVHMHRPAVLRCACLLFHHTLCLLASLLSCAFPLLKALNAAKMAEVLAEAEGQHRDGIIVPQPILELTTRRVLTMEWVTGVKVGARAIN